MATRQPDPARTYSEMLQRAGWDPTAFHLRRDLKLSIGPNAEPIPGRVFSIRRGGETAAALVVLEGIRFPSASALYNRYIDMTLEGRLCLRAAAALCEAPFAFVASPYECFFYDLETEELLLSAVSPEESAGRIFPIFTPEAFANGALERLPRRSARQWGRDLRDWIRVWAIKLGRATSTPVDTTSDLLGHWLLAWKEALSAKAGKGPDPLGIEVRGADDPTEITAQDVAPAAFLTAHIAPLRERFPLGTLLARREREEKFWRDENAVTILTQFLDEARLLSRDKFRVVNTLYAFTDEETEKNSWVAALTSRDGPERSMRRNGLTIYDPLVVDIETSGFGWALARLEELTRFWMRENLERKSEVHLRGSSGVQLDMLSAPPAGMNADGFLDDILRFVIAHAYRLRVADGNERQLAGLLVAMKIVELAEAYGMPLTAFPEINGIFEG